MLMRIYLSCLIFVVTIGSGVWSVEYLLHYFNGFDDLKIGQWEVVTQNSGENLEPYARARATKFTLLTLGSAEGQVFAVWHDDTGKKLQRACRYRLEGKIPEASFFTLYAVDKDGNAEKSFSGRPHELTSETALRQEDGTYLIKIAPQAQSGNWLTVEHDISSKGSEYGLILTLYATPLMTLTGLTRLNLPRLSKIDNDGNSYRMNENGEREGEISKVGDKC